MGSVTTVCLPFAYVGETDLSRHHDPVTVGWGETRAEGGANPVLKQVCECEPSTGRVFTRAGRSSRILLGKAADNARFPGLPISVEEIPKKVSHMYL